tara:strand:+ start:26 stop:448 length:423 start_codon:yes stop_codon:yes gene_type:complete
MRYENVKVGDSVFEIKCVSLTHWGNAVFARYFAIEKQVIRVTKTQFATDSGRYKKCGLSIGDSNVIGTKGEFKSSWNKVHGVINSCELSEMTKYKNRVKNISDGSYKFSVDRLNIVNAKTIEDAEKAIELMKQLNKLLEK